MLRCSWPPTSTANNKNNNSNDGLQCWWWWWLPSSLSLTGHGTALSFSNVALPLSLSLTHTQAHAQFNLRSKLVLREEIGPLELCVGSVGTYQLLMLSARGRLSVRQFFFLLVDLYLPLVRTVGRSERYLKRNSKRQTSLCICSIFVFN